MQKKIIALAVAGLASTAAFAQSNVTIYGVADATFEYAQATGSVNSGIADFKGRNRVTSNSSYIGFKGTEDLGNGLKAMFQIESGVNMDNGGGTAGATGGSWANRDSYVGLSGGFGTVVLGNLTGPTRALGAKLDPYSGATGAGANTALLGKLGGALGDAGAGYFDQRLNNAVAYVSPTIAGLTATVGYTAGFSVVGNTGGNFAANGTTAESNAAGMTVTGNKGYTGGLSYEAGPVYAAYSYTAVDFNTNDVDGALGQASNHRVGVIGKIGTMGQVGFLFDQTKASFSGLGLTTQNTYYVNGKLNVGKGAVIAQYGLANDVKGTQAQGIQDTGARHFSVGYEHYLSKRTTLKATYAQIWNEQNATYDFLNGVSSANTTLTTATNSAGVDPRVISVGVRHAF